MRAALNVLRVFYLILLAVFSVSLPVDLVLSEDRQQTTAMARFEPEILKYLQDVSEDKMAQCWVSDAASRRMGKKVLRSLHRAGE